MGSRWIREHGQGKPANSLEEGYSQKIEHRWIDYFNNQQAPTHQGWCKYWQTYPNDNGKQKDSSPVGKLPRN